MNFRAFAPAPILLLALSNPVIAQGPIDPASAAAAPSTVESPIEATVRDEFRTLKRVEGGWTADAIADRAVASGPSLAVSRAMVELADISVKRARQAFYPRLVLQASYTRLSNVTNGGLGGDTDGAALDTLLAGVDDLEARLLLTGFTSFEFPVILNQISFRASLAIPVSDLFFTILPSYHAAKHGAKAQRAQVAVREAEIRLRAKETFYQFANATAAVDVANASLAQAEAQRKRTATLVSAGAAANVDLRRVDTLVAQAKVAVAQSKAAAEISERAVRTLIHDPKPIAFAPNFLSEGMPKLPSTKLLIERAKQHRPEYEALSELVMVRKKTLKAALGGRYPQLFVQANADISNPNQRIFPQTQTFQPTWDITAALKWSPNDYADASQRAAAERVELLKIESDRQQLADGIEIAVVQASAQMKAAEESLKAARVGRDAAESNYQTRKKQLDAGVVVTSDMIDAEADLSRARLLVVDAVVGLRLSAARLEHACGQSLAELAR